MFGPSYFRQVGWIGDGEIIREDELEGLDGLQEQWDALVERSLRAHLDLGRPEYMFDRQRDVVEIFDEEWAPHSESITWDELVERETGYRPLMEFEVDEIEGESAYQQAQELKGETLDALVENLPTIAVAVADVLNEYVLIDAASIEDGGPVISVAFLAEAIREAVEKAIDDLDIAELGAQLLSDISGLPING